MTRALLLLVTTLLGATSALGFNSSGFRWTWNRNVVMHLSLGGGRVLQDGSASFNQSAADALGMWNPVLAHMQFVARSDSPLPPAEHDFDNSVFFASTIFGRSFGGNVLAVTLNSSRGGSLYVESDVIFNSAVAWDSYRGPRQSAAEEFRRVAVHEFGHVLGLNHPDDDGQRVNAIMNSRVSNIETLQSDDVNGARSIYGSGSDYRSAQPSSNLVNLSTRGFVGTGDAIMIGGFVAEGPEPITVVLRAVGHSLAGSGVPAPLNDPMMEVRNANGMLIAVNDDWIDGPDAATIASYRLDPSNSLESALLQTLAPGSYTVLVRAFDNNDGLLTGTALIELYDLHTTNGRARNISTRAQVQTGDDVMIAGFVIGGSQPKEVVLRGLGPSLLDSGVPGVLNDPIIEVRNASSQLIATNDNWETDPTAPRVRALNLAPRRNVESAVAVTLNAGAYTVIMRGVDGGTGIGLIEVYDVGP